MGIIVAEDNTVVYDIAIRDSAGNVVLDLDMFKEHYLHTTDCMKELCIEAARLAEVDSKHFRDYVLYQLHMSRSAYNMIVNAGNLYILQEGLHDISYTKVAELAPVREQIDDYIEYAGGVEEIQKATQSELRKKVKDYIKLAQDQIISEDDIQVSSNTKDDNIVVNSDYMEIKGTVEMIKHYLAEFADSTSEGVIIDSNDVKLCKAHIYNLDMMMQRVRSILDDNNIPYTDIPIYEEGSVEFD